MTIPASSALYSRASQTWNTPIEVIERLRAFDPRGVALDPCSNDTSLVGPHEEWRIERGEDGLARPWPDLGLVFVNPPYDELEVWARKMAAEAARHVEVLALIPARPDTCAFQRHILPTCTALFFWRGRMRYGSGLASSSQAPLFSGERVKLEHGENVAPFPSCLPYWGRRSRAFLRAFEPTGWGVVCR